jgi:hypothetical protein
MINAKEEFLDMCKGKTVSCATIVHEYWTEGMLSPASVQRRTKADLKCNYTPEDFKEFLKYLDFQYDRGHGLQEIFGTVWFEDSTWATRGEYDGSEWWEVHEIPEIPDHLKIR